MPTTLLLAPPDCHLSDLPTALHDIKQIFSYLHCERCSFYEIQFYIERLIFKVTLETGQKCIQLKL